MKQYLLQLAEMRDIETAVSLINDGRQYLKEQGSDQWQNGYPDAEIIREDILCRRGYFITDGDDKLAYLCLDFKGEPAYTDIKGKWKSNQPYAVIHRVAVSRDKVGNGLSAAIFHLSEELCREKGIYSMRADTDLKNKIMQHILKKHGFEYCGTVWFVDSDKLAFEKVLDR